MESTLLASRVLFVLCYTIILSNCFETRSYDTIVIGLGASGTAAASKLARAGKQVLALEAQDRIGGRVFTVPFGDGLVEVGAEWIQGETHSPTYDLAVKNDINIQKQERDGGIYRSDGSFEDVPLLTELLDYAMEVYSDPPPDTDTVGHHITTRLMDYIRTNRTEALTKKDLIEQLMVYLNLAVCNLEATSDWNDVTTNSLWEELEGYQEWSWHRYGYKTLFDILLNNYNNGTGLPTLTIKLNTEVTNIRWTPDSERQVEVMCADGNVYTAANVIVTPSVGVLKEKHSTLFSPPLPQDKVRALNVIDIGVVGKIILSFSQKWWPNASFFGLVWRGEDLKKVSEEDYWTTKIHSASTPMGSDNTMTLWSSGEIAKLVETLPEETVKTKSKELLQKFFGANCTVSEPTGIIRSKWYSNPYTKGSYSYDTVASVQFPEFRSVLAEPLKDNAGNLRVLFAGEATNPTHFAMVHGAVETGFREADRLLGI